MKSFSYVFKKLVFVGVLGIAGIQLLWSMELNDHKRKSYESLEQLHGEYQDKQAKKHKE